MNPTKESFLENVKDHKMEILNDCGIYRTIKFSRPESNNMYFMLTTWDGHLTISGDMGTFTFERTNDMFDFFSKDINPHYWSEKLRTGTCSGWKIAEEYDHEELIKTVWEYFNDYWNPDVIEEELTIDPNNEAILEEKERYDQCKEDLEWLLTWDSHENLDIMSHKLYEFESGEFNFYDSDFFSEGFNPTKWTNNYLWCCYAIVWGIEQYKELKTKESYDPMMKTCNEFVKKVLN